MSGNKEARLRIELPDGRVFHSTAVIQDEIEQQPQQYAAEMRVWLGSAAVTLATYIREPVTYNFTVPEKKPVQQRDKPLEELIAERFEGIDQRIREVSGAWKDAHDALEAAMLQQRDGWAQRFADIEKKIEANGISDDSLKAWNETTKITTARLDAFHARMVPLESYYEVAHTCVHTTPDEAKKLEARLSALESPLPSGQFQHVCDRLKALEKGFAECTVSRNEFRALQDQVEELDGINQQGEGIKVVIHDFPRYEDGSWKLHEIAGALRKLGPTRVLVNSAGVGKAAAETLRTQWGLPVEPLPKRTNPVPRSPDCPAHDTRCRPGACFWETTRASPADTWAQRR